MSSPFQALLARLWWGPLRRPFEALTRRALGDRVVAGPLAGRRFSGGLAQRLGIYEIHVQDALSRHLGPGDVFYDVGGHRGYFALLAASRVRPGGRVVVFEPLPENLAAIRKNLEANDAEGVEPVAAAVCDGRGTASLFRGDDAAATATLQGASGSRSIEVATTSLDLFREDEASPDFCKVDVEGAEDRVLAGAAGLLASGRTRWLIEVHSAEKEETVRGLLQGSGHRVEELVSRWGRRRAYPRHLLAGKPA